MKYLFVFINLIIITGSGLAADPGWSVNSNSYSNSMTITGVLKLNNAESLDANDKVGAFVNGECRGVVSLTYVASANRYIAFLLVYSNVSSGEEITFKAYDASGDAIVELKNKKDYVIDEIRGSISEPYVFLNTTPEKSINSFGFVGFQHNATLNATDKIVHVIISNGADLATLVAEFSLSEGAVAIVNSVEQKSGETENNFVSAVTYTIVALDGTEETWTVTVEKSNLLGVNKSIEKNSFLIYPVPASTEISIVFNSHQSSEYSIQIFNQKGEGMVIYPVLNNSKLSIPVSEFPEGMYYVMLSDKSGSYSQVFIKE